MRSSSVHSQSVALSPKNTMAQFDNGRVCSINKLASSTRSRFPGFSSNLTLEEQAHLFYIIGFSDSYLFHVVGFLEAHLFILQDFQGLISFILQDFFRFGFFISQNVLAQLNNAIIKDYSSSTNLSISNTITYSHVFIHPLQLL